MNQSSGPLAGVTALDLTTEIGGPFCGKLLADFGAEVIKVEPPAGDPSRRLGPFPAGGPDPERSAAFLYLNTNKKSVLLDLYTPEGREHALRLSERADAVIENFPPGELERLGLGWDVLHARRPSLVLTSVSAFGQDGPYAGFRATNLTAQAMGGQMWLTGEPDREPLKQGGFQADYQAGLNAFAATAVALFAARLTGEGERIDIAAQACMAAVLEGAMPFYAYLERTGTGRRGNIMSAAIGLYPCADGYLGVHAMPRNWGPLTETMGMPELATDERFATGGARLANNDELVAVLYAWAADQHKKDVFARAGRLRGPVAYVHTIEDLFTSPQLQARDFLQQVDHPVAGRLTYPGAPFQMSASPRRAGRAPLLGEHTAEVLGEVGGGPHPPAPSPNTGRGGDAVGTGRLKTDAEPPKLEARSATASPLPVLGEGSGVRARSLPLEGVRILDLTMVWAGPYATRLLGDMGAEVIKVESVNFYDQLRALHLLPPEIERRYNRSSYFNHNNRDKLGLSLDLADEHGRDTLLRLAATCDVVIENYRADVLERLGLGYEALRAVRPDVILVSMPGHGKSGPERGYVAYGTNVEQLAGLVSLTGYVDGPPQKSGISYGDPIAGTIAAGAVALALLHRERTGEGQYIELAQREGLTSLIGEAVVGYSLTGELPKRTGNGHPIHAPHDVYRCDGEDAWVAIACTSDEEFASLCRVIGRQELAEDERFRDAAARHAHQAELTEPITAWTLGRGHRAAMEELQSAGVPAGAVLTVPELFADPQLRTRGFFEQIAHAEAGVWDMDGIPWRLRQRPAHIRIPAPRFAEHNRYVLHDLLGLSDDELDALAAAGLTGEQPNEAVHQ